MTTPEDFARQFPFALDAFQHEAIDAVHRGMSTLVAAPTGSGNEHNAGVRGTEPLRARMERHGEGRPEAEQEELA